MVPYKVGDFDSELLRRRDIAIVTKAQLVGQLVDEEPSVVNLAVWSMLACRAPSLVVEGLLRPFLKDRNRILLSLMRLNCESGYEPVSRARPGSNAFVLIVGNNVVPSGP